jgi:hypothetical protein
MISNLDRAISAFTHVLEPLTLNSRCGMWVTAIAGGKREEGRGNKSELSESAIENFLTALAVAT